MTVDATHDPGLRSWVESANDPATDFPIQNLPYGRFRHGSPGAAWRAGIAIGAEVLDLQAAGLVASPDIVHVMQTSPAGRRALRQAISAGLRAGSERAPSWRSALHRQSEVEIGLPCDIGDYTDFYTGIHHATAVGKLFRPDNPLLPNYAWVPIGYHGRASSVLASGHTFRRPQGQIKPPDPSPPTLAPTCRLDYELEMGIVIATPNELGRPVGMGEAEEHVFGLTLLNDWSARDIQAWEYQPLGPFLAKSFATTISPWVVTLEALAPFREPFRRPAGDPSPLPYLDSATNRAAGTVGVELEVWIETPRMRDAGSGPVRVSRSSFRDSYWTLAQLVAHHTVNGCNLRSGDLLGTGTLSGPAPEQGGSLLELTRGGKEPVQLPNGETRVFLEDGDAIILRGYCAREGYRRIGFGECRATALPAPTLA
ncbi:MAG TPA: fumarylacetoacetase [Steroidobacteraceae bacterium]